MTAHTWSARTLWPSKRKGAEWNEHSACSRPKVTKRTPWQRINEPGWLFHVRGSSTRLQQWAIATKRSYGPPASPSKPKQSKRQVSLATFHHWQTEKEKEHQTLIWLGCDKGKHSKYLEQAVEAWWSNCKTVCRPNQRSRQQRPPRNAGASTSTDHEAEREDIHFQWMGCFVWLQQWRWLLWWVLHWVDSYCITVTKSSHRFGPHVCTTNHCCSTLCTHTDVLRMMYWSIIIMCVHVFLCRFYSTGVVFELLF